MVKRVGEEGKKIGKKKEMRKEKNGRHKTPFLQRTPPPHLTSPLSFSFSFPPLLIIRKKGKN
jgi:hypothetical protein